MMSDMNKWLKIVESAEVVTEGWQTHRGHGTNIQLMNDQSEGWAIFWWPGQNANDNPRVLYLDDGTNVDDMYDQIQEFLEGY